MEIRHILFIFDWPFWGIKSCNKIFICESMKQALGEHDEIVGSAEGIHEGVSILQES